MVDARSTNVVPGPSSSQGKQREGTVRGGPPCSPPLLLSAEYKLVPHRKPIETVDYNRSVLSEAFGERFERRYRLALRRHPLLGSFLTKGLHALGSGLVLLSLHLEDQSKTLILSTVGGILAIPPVLHGLLYMNPQILRLLRWSFDFWFTLTLIALQLAILTCRIGIDARAFAMDFLYFASASLTACMDALHPAVRKGGKLQVTVGVAFSLLLGLYVAFNLIPDSRFLDTELLGEHSTDLSMNLISIGAMLLLRTLYRLVKDRRGLVSFVMIRSLVQLVETSSPPLVGGLSPSSEVGTREPVKTQPRAESKYAVHPGPVSSSPRFHATALGTKASTSLSQEGACIVKGDKRNASIDSSTSSEHSGGDPRPLRISYGTIDKDFIATMDKLRFRGDRLLLSYLGGPGRCLLGVWGRLSGYPLMLRQLCGFLYLGSLSAWSVVLTLSLTARDPSIEDCTSLVVISVLAMLQLCLLTLMLHVDLVVLLASSSFDAVFLSAQGALLTLGLSCLVEGDLRLLFLLPLWGILQFSFLLDAFLPVLALAFGFSRQLFGWLLHLTALAIEILLLLMVITNSIETESTQSEQYFFKMQNIFRKGGGPLRMWYHSFIITRLFTLVAYRVRLLFRTQHCLVLLRASFSIETRRGQEENKSWTEPSQTAIEKLRTTH